MRHGGIIIIALLRHNIAERARIKRRKHITFFHRVADSDVDALDISSVQNLKRCPILGINGAGKLERFSNIAYGDLRQRNRGSAFFTYHNIDGYADGYNKHRSNDTDDDFLLFIKYFLCHRNSP